LLFAIVAGSSGAACGEDLAANDLYNLIASGTEGTTIVLEGGAQRTYFSQRLKNVARLGLGPKFMQEQWSDMIAEGVFVSSVAKGGKTQLISGLAGIMADKSTGNGILLFVQTFPTDKSLSAFQTQKDRLFSVMTVDETGPALLCTRSEWTKMSQAERSRAKRTGPCEFVVGNLVAVNSPR
jgi:hypothetical protein